MYKKQGICSQIESCDNKLLCFTVVGWSVFFSGSSCSVMSQNFGIPLQFHNKSRHNIPINSCRSSAMNWWVCSLYVYRYMPLEAGDCKVTTEALSSAIPTTSKVPSNDSFMPEWVCVWGLTSIVGVPMWFLDSTTSQVMSLKPLTKVG